MPTFDSDRPMDVLGVPGRLTHRTTQPGQAAGLWFRQRWISEARPISGYGLGAVIRAEIRFDDDPSNGHNTFAITGDVYAIVRKHRRDIAGGCLHDDIAAIFPELASLICWHLTSTDGPMHYLANTVHHAGDRDCWGLRKGETRQVKTRDGSPRWELVAVNSLGIAISGTPTGLAYTGAETVPLFILEQHWTGESPPVVPTLEWRPSVSVGEGKARELDHARSAAVWPEATDADLCQEPDALRAVLTARLPALLADFRRDMEATGFYWSPEDATVAT